MNRFLNSIYLPIDYFCIGLIYGYRIFISPLKPKSCAFIPSCSIYTILAIKEWHFYKGIKLGFKRILRCNPKNKGGYDFVPLNIKGDLRWIL